MYKVLVIFNKLMERCISKGIINVSNYSTEFGFYSKDALDKFIKSLPDNDCMYIYLGYKRLTDEDLHPAF